MYSLKILVLWISGFFYKKQSTILSAELPHEECHMACVPWQAPAAGLTGLSRAVITLVVELFWLTLAQWVLCGIARAHAISWV